MKYKRNVYTAEDGSRVADAINALDYPSLPLSDDLWVIWTAANKWPNADRAIRYLSRTQTAAVGGFALLTSNHRDARRYASELEAQADLAAQNVLRSTPWHGLRITTVEVMKLLCGFYVEKDSNDAE